VTDMLLGGFSECSGLESTLVTEDYKQGGDNGKTLRFPSRVKWEDITLKRGVGLFSSPSSPLPVGISLWDWHYSFVQGKGKRRDGIIILQNELRIPYNIWMFRQGLPVKYSGPTLNAKENVVAIESLVIAHHGLYQLPFVSEAAGIATAAINKAASG
jgi:phage tail-like protein